MLVIGSWKSMFDFHTLIFDLIFVSMQLLLTCFFTRTWRWIAIFPLKKKMTLADWLAYPNRRKLPTQKSQRWHKGLLVKVTPKTTTLHRRWCLLLGPVFWIQNAWHSAETVLLHPFPEELLNIRGLWIIGAFWLEPTTLWQFFPSIFLAIWHILKMTDATIAWRSNTQI